MTDPVRDQYEALPYPARDPRDEAKRLIEGSPSHLLEVNHYVFAGRRDFRRPFRALVAGGGTGDATVMLAQHLADRGCPAEIVHLDLSDAAIRLAAARAGARGLGFVRFVAGSLEDLPGLGLGRFDYIDCCGVLHHLADDKIADLSDFVPLKFDGSENLVDAAIAELSTSDFTCATLSDFYGLPNSSPVAASLGMPIKKVGRTSVLTTGTVAAINATVDVGYGPAGVARFIGQIVTTKQFIKSGDSGSLAVTDDANHNPVGLLFAGTSNGLAIVNPIGEVLSSFNVTICGN